MQCPQCGTFLNATQFQTGPDGSPLCPFCGASVRGQQDLLDAPVESPWPAQQSSGGEIPGLISIVCGGVSLLCIPFLCCTFGLSVIVAVPLSLIGIGCGLWSTGALRVIGLTLNFIAFVTAAMICAYVVYLYLNSGPFEGPPEVLDLPSRLR